MSNNENIEKIKLWLICKSDSCVFINSISIAQQKWENGEFGLIPNNSTCVIADRLPCGLDETRVV